MSTPTVASLLPSATEIVCALGAQERLVGRSHECDFPTEVADRPILTRPRVPSEGLSGAIDRDVRALVAQALAVYEVDTVALAAADPEVIVTQDLCEVCAVSLGDVQRALQEMGSWAEVVSLSPMRLSEVWDGVIAVGKALGLEEPAREVRAGLERRLEELRARCTRDSRPKVLTIEWLDPVMLGGTWMPELVEAAGGDAIGVRAGEHAPTLDSAALADLDPDVVVFKPCGFPLERTLAEEDTVRAIAEDAGWNAPVWIADGNALFNRPGPRLVESAEVLAGCIWEDEPDPHAWAKRIL